MSYILSKSNRKDKKWAITTPEGKTVHFGQEGYLDYTMHKDPVRKQAYISRHGAPSSREDWTKSGISSPGFWSKHLLWNKPSLDESISDVEKKFKIRIIKK
jgi:hypothetical protein